VEITRVYLSCLKGVENVGVTFPFSYIHFVRLPYYYLRKKMAEIFGYNLYVSILNVTAQQ